MQIHHVVEYNFFEDVLGLVKGCAKSCATKVVVGLVICTLLPLGVVGWVAKRFQLL